VHLAVWGAAAAMEDKPMAAIMMAMILPNIIFPAGYVAYGDVAHSQKGRQAKLQPR
jgi:hypothetical protein